MLAQSIGGGGGLAIDGDAVFAGSTSTGNGGSGGSVTVNVDAFGAIAAMVLLSALTGNKAVADNPQAALADAVRGGWVADIEGVRHIFILKVLDGAVSGIHCEVDCSDPARLSLLEHGSLTADAVRFQIHRLDGKAPERTEVVGRISGGELLLTFERDASGKVTAVKGRRFGQEFTGRRLE